MNRKLLSCFVALTCMFLLRWLTSRFLFISYDALSGGIRDVAVISSIVVLAAVAMTAMWRPSSLSARGYFVITAICLVCGCLGVWAAQALGSIPLGYIAAAITDIGSALVCLGVCLSCLDLGARKSAACIACAFAVAFLLRFPLGSIAPEAGVPLFALAAFAALLTSTRSVKVILGRVSALEAPATTVITRPATLLPFAHKAFVALILFEAAYGYAVTFNVADITGTNGIIATCWLVLVAALSFCALCIHKPDWLFLASLAAVLAGMLASTVDGDGFREFSGLAFSIGSSSFQVAAFYYLIAIAERNEAGGIVTLAWGMAAMSLGVVVGANLGKAALAWAVGPSGASVTEAVAIFVFVVAFFLLLNGFSIRETIESVEDGSPQIVTHPELPELSLTQKCDAISSRYGLTAREAEVLKLLAKGRNSPFIQEELCVSYNTARTHVRHVYMKCGFHTQQELIDAVEKAAI